MSMEPIQRQMTNPAAGVFQTPALLIDNITQLSFIVRKFPPAMVITLVARFSRTVTGLAAS